MGIHVCSHSFFMTIDPARPSAALPVSTDTTVDVTVLAVGWATLVGQVTFCVAVMVAAFPP